MKQLLKRVKTRSQDQSGDVVQTVLIIGGFVLVAIVIVIWLGTAMTNKGADAASCIESVKAPNVQTTDAGTADACAAINHSSTKSFTSDSTYQQRY